MLNKISLECIDCKKNYPYHRKEYRCDCGNLLEVKQDFTSYGQEILQKFQKRLEQLQLPLSSGVWRYKELVLDIPENNIVSRNEGNTNLYDSKILSGYTKIKNLKIKHEGENPTGSFKDRGMTSAISMAKYLGYKSVACASTGNTSASMASFAATCGLQSYVFIPDGDIAYGKLSQALAYGGKTIQIKGNFDDAMDMVQKVCSELDIYLLNSINPYRIEGQKSIVIELMHQLNWNPPNWIVLPGGNLGNTSAFGKAIKELYGIGLISKIPRLAVIQAQGANPFYEMISKKENSISSMEPHTIASAIKIGNPVSWKKAKNSIDYTGGVVDQLSEKKIMDAKAYVDKSGIGAEPASCCSIGGAKKLREKGIIKEDESVVCILTGNILKDTDSTINYHMKENNEMSNKPIKVDCDFEKIKNLIKMK
ncbi:threonine synthase [archaeon]|jgi:threonine synthase|nr:threonine synthase [archaeon]MBT4352747.1 threonine synthase [archaeon]MBT4648150.1 threonine synthase [archaeon]MBT6822432.1 threonine synthase [archaeon]MBT7391901.1 threonine synthase [archaeon]